MTKFKEDKAKQKFDRIIGVSNKNIDNNERVVDMQTIVIAISLFAQLFVVFSVLKDADTNTWLHVLVALTVVFSCFSLIVSLAVPSFFIHRNRALIERLEQENDLCVEKLKRLETEMRDDYISRHIESIRLFVTFVALVLLLILYISIFIWYL